MQMLMESPSPKYYITFLNRRNLKVKNHIEIRAKENFDTKSYFNILENSLISKIQADRKFAALKIQTYFRSKTL
jgi:hypothetical protein